MIKLDTQEEIQMVEPSEAPIVQAEPQPIQAQPVSAIPQVDFGKKEVEKREENRDYVKESSDKTTQLVDGMFQQAVVHTVANDDEVKQSILDTAKEVVGDKVETISNQSKVEKKKSKFLLFNDDCSNYGIDEAVAGWKVKLMAVGSAFWFIIYFIIASVTVAPITIFMKGLLGAVKKIWLAILLAVVFYLLLGVGLPLLISYLSGAFGA